MEGREGNMAAEEIAAWAARAQQKRLDQLAEELPAIMEADPDCQFPESFTSSEGEEEWSSEHEYDNLRGNNSGPNRRFDSHNIQKPPVNGKQYDYNDGGEKSYQPMTNGGGDQRRRKPREQQDNFGEPDVPGTDLLLHKNVAVPSVSSGYRFEEAPRLGNDDFRHKSGKARFDPNNELRMLLTVRDREVESMKQKIYEMETIQQDSVNRYKRELNICSMEKKRALNSLEECQNKLKASLDQISELTNKYEELKESEEKLRLNREMDQLTIRDKDNMIQILESASHENYLTERLKKQLKEKEGVHNLEMENMNDQLARSFKECKFLEKTVMDLQTKIEEIMTEKADTVTRLMTEIAALQKLNPPCSSPQRIIQENMAANTTLRNELVEKDAMVAHLQTELAAVKSYTNQFASEKHSQKTVETKQESAQTEEMPQNDNIARYLKFHDEEKSKLKGEYEIVLKQRDATIENLRSENEEVKKLCLDQMEQRAHVDAQLLQQRERLQEMRNTHSEVCQAELAKRESTIQNLEAEAEKLLTKLLEVEKREKEVKDSLDTKESEIMQMRLLIAEMETSKAQHEADIKEYEVKLTEHSKKEALLEANMESWPREELKAKKVVTDAATSPLHKCGEKTKFISETELMDLLDNLASKHDEERFLLEARIQDLTSRQNPVRALEVQKSVCDAMTETEPLVEPSSELTLELWRKLEYLQRQNDELTVQKRSCEEAEAELSSLKDQYKKLWEKATRLRNELTTATEKFKRLKFQAKANQELFTKVITKMKEEEQRERKNWEKERKLFDKGQELWEKEKSRWEAVLMNLRAEVQSLKAPQIGSMLESVAKMYDDVLATVPNEK